MNDADKKTLEISRIFDKLGKVSITIDNGNDIAFLTCALLQYLTDDRDKAEAVLRTVVADARVKGAEQAVETLVKVCEETYSQEVVKIPKFFKPLFTLTIDHFIKEEKNKKDNS